MSDEWVWTETRVSIPLEDWLWMHRLIGETSGMVDCIALQVKGTSLEHAYNPLTGLSEQWNAFVEAIGERGKYKREPHSSDSGREGE